ncbi:MAG TPA: hypothetical protein EYP39_03640 [Ghiorsea sp.]|nr:hypothetical protein [Ghiorsea sp.]
MRWCTSGFLLALLFPTLIFASNANKIELGSSAFWTGFAGGIIAHELGHIAVASAYGQKARLHAGSVIYPNSSFSPQESLRVSTAGFQTQWLFSEWSFYQLDKEEETILRQQHYVGLITSHIAISLVYMAGLKDEPTSDIYAASITSGRSRDELAWMALAPALLDTYRLFGHDVPAWVDYMSIGLKTAEIGFIWTF